MEPVEQTSLTDPNTMPGGQSYEHMRTLQTQTAQTNNELTTTNTDLATQLAAAQAELTTLKTSPPTSTPTTNVDDKGGDMFNFTDGMMRMDDGKINPLLVTTLDKIGIKGDMALNFVGHMENSIKYNKHLNDVTITETVGTQANYDALLGWANENMDQTALAKVNAGLNNRDMMGYAVQDLMAQAKVAGFAFADQPQVPVSNEPTVLPASSGGTNVSTAPLIPNSNETIAAFQDPRYRTDPAYKEIVHQRLAAGAKRP